MGKMKRWVAAVLVAVSALFVLPPSAPLGVEKAAAAEYDYLLEQLLARRMELLVASGYAVEAAYAMAVYLAYAEYLLITNPEMAAQMFESSSETEIGWAAEAGFGYAW